MVSFVASEIQENLGFNSVAEKLTWLSLLWMLAEDVTFSNTQVREIVRLWGGNFRVIDGPASRAPLAAEP